MACPARWLAVMLFALGVGVLPLRAQETPRPPDVAAPAAVTDDEARLLELGKLLMGQNNAAYATTRTQLNPEERNLAGGQAVRTFQALVKRNPKHAEGWLWLGIALTEGRRYTQKHPEGEPLQEEPRLSDGITAFRTAYELAPDKLAYVSYYAEALMTFRKDFDAVRNLWNTFLQVADSDNERVTALCQAARASLNKAYFGKSQKMKPDEIKAAFTAAEENVRLAAKLCPRASLVLEMQGLLAKHRAELLGGK